jgi:hypothetical protein
MGVLGGFSLNRRGALSATLAVSVTTLLGLVGTRTEVGSRYVGQPHGRNAADVAAMAGALMLAGGKECCSGAGVWAISRIESTLLPEIEVGALPGDPPSWVPYWHWFKAVPIISAHAGLAMRPMRQIHYQIITSCLASGSLCFGFIVKDSPRQEVFQFEI